MKLHARDYSRMTASEEAKLEDLRRQEPVGPPGRLQARRSLYRQYPKAARHCLSLFPNNFLDVVELRRTESLKKRLAQFKRLLNSQRVTERDILNFINEKRAFFIVASLLKSYYNWGHHAAFLFPEFPLGVSCKVDYLLVGKNSGGWEFLFVELESPNGNVTLKDGSPGDVIRKGELQIAKWKAWIEANFSSLREVFYRKRNQTHNLPDEFLNLDTTRIHYAVIAGRRKHYNGSTYWHRRRIQRNAEVLILHYDNMVETAKNVIGEMTY
jgi:hypothetical protein